MIKQWVLYTIIRWKTMGRSRKYQLSISLSSDLIDLIEKAVDESEHTSRSAFLEDLIRENIHSRCLRCEINDRLVKHHLRSELPPTMDEALKLIEESEFRKSQMPIIRTQEKVILEIVSQIQNQVGTYANLLDVITEAERKEIPRTKAEDIIDKLCRDGRMMRPGGYETVQVVT